MAGMPVIFSTGSLVELKARHIRSVLSQIVDVTAQSICDTWVGCIADSKQVARASSILFGPQVYPSIYKCMLLPGEIVS